MQDVTITRTVHEPPTACKALQDTLLVWNAINPPSYMKYYRVESVEEAKRVINKLAKQQLKNNLISCNAFGLVRCEHTLNNLDDEDPSGWEWCEWENDDGDDIESVMRAEENT